MKYYQCVLEYHHRNKKAARKKSAIKGKTHAFFTV